MRARLRQQLRIGLGLKAVIALAFIVFAVTVGSGWAYFLTVRHGLREQARQQAEQLATATARAARADLAAGHTDALRRQAAEHLTNPDVRHVTILNRHGRPVAQSGGRPGRWDGLANLPTSVRQTRRDGVRTLVLARPVLDADRREVLGAVRIVVDTGRTTDAVEAVQVRVATVAALTVLLGIPLSYLLVWRLLVGRVHRLVSAVRRFGRGRFESRARAAGDDEIAELAQTFNTMAGQVVEMRAELVGANARLERAVERRTEQLQIANRRLRGEIAEKDAFVRAVSHDLGAPLRNIAGMAALTMAKWRDELPEEVIARLQRIQANVDVEADMINELLELSRIRTRPQTRQWVDTGELVAKLAETFAHELEQRRIRLSVDAGLPTLHVEPRRLRQAFQNLIDNAIKYMHREAGGTIHVDYRFVEGCHEFSVADNGPGIPPDRQADVFCVFRRADADGRADGKGVGLAVVRTIAANYDGRAWVESAPGEGAIFHFSLDARRTVPSAPEPPDDASEAQAEDGPADDAQAFEPVARC